MSKKTKKSNNRKSIEQELFEKEFLNNYRNKKHKLRNKDNRKRKHEWWKYSDDPE